MPVVSAIIRETIFALSTAPGKAGIAVFRLSGPLVPPLLKQLTRLDHLPPPRMACLRSFWDKEEKIDKGLLLYFPAPSSYTGEEMAELHLHGGSAILKAMAQHLARQPGVRLAEPGEFSRRAFDNGKLDLSEIEGLADLIAAETDAQRRQALRQAEGQLRRQCLDWQDALLRLQAQIEAWIDFPEEDLPRTLLRNIETGLEDLRAEISRHLSDRRRGEILRQGYRIVLLGPPNAGKSSLLNYLAKRDVAIVSHEPGTTRDLLEVALDLDGYAVLLTDTAGLRETSSDIEAEGIRRAKNAAQEAQLRLHLSETGNWLESGGPEDLLIHTKIDTNPNQARKTCDIIGISTRTGEGIDRLIETIAERVKNALEEEGPAPVLTRERHRQALVETREALARAQNSVLPELLGEEIRLAHRALGRIVGQAEIETMLDLLFREFCIGK